MHHTTTTKLLASLTTQICVLAGLVAAWSTTQIWLHGPSRDFTGLERTGTYVLVFACGLIAATILRAVIARFRRPLGWVAGGCALAATISSVAGSGPGGYLAPRWVATIAALVALTALFMELIGYGRAHPDLQRNAYSGLFFAWGAMAACAAFMSWGEWAFLVNYVPGVDGDGFGGKWSLAFGVLLMAIGGGAARSGTWRSACWAVLILGILIFFAGESGTMPRGSHGGRGLTIFAGLMAVVSGIAGLAAPSEVLHRAPSPEAAPMTETVTQAS